MTDFPTIATLDWQPHPRHSPGERALVYFANGYGASVLRGGEEHGFWTTDGGTYEICIIRHGLPVSTPLSESYGATVFNWLTEEDANQALVDIAALAGGEAGE